MLTGTLDSMRRERAALARDVEYFRTFMFEDTLDDRELEISLSQEGPEDAEEYRAAAETLEQIPEEDDFSDDEIERILDSDHDLSFDEMICDECDC